MLSKNSTILTAVVTTLTAIALGVIIYKVAVLKLPVKPGEERKEILLEARISYEAEDEPVTVKLSLPKHLEDQVSLAESASVGYGFRHNRGFQFWNAQWAARWKTGHERLYYRLKLTALDALKKTYPLIEEEEIPEIIPPTYGKTIDSLLTDAAATLIARYGEQSADLRGLVDEMVRDSLSTTSSQELVILKRHYQHHHEEDWHIHFFKELLAFESIPTRIGVGLIFNPDANIQEAHQVRVIEYLDNNTWRTVNLYSSLYSDAPESLLVWKRNGDKVVSVKGGHEAKVKFMMEIERNPAVEGFENHSFWFSTLASLPLTERGVFSYITLIPLGIVIVIFFRNIIGVSSLGTFMPVLLALAFLEMKAVAGVMAFLSILGIGLLFRTQLTHLHLLIIPRVGACVIIVTILMILASVMSYQFGFSEGLRITVFPMIVLAWTIERMSILWEEEGAKIALRQIGGSVIISVVAYWTMRQELVKYWLFYFPEILLILLSITLMIGRYFGYRFLELFRFNTLAKEI